MLRFLGTLLFLVAANLEVGPERPVATPADVPAPAQLDAIVPDHGGFVVFWSRPHLDNSAVVASFTLVARRVDNAGRQVTADQEVLPATDRTRASITRKADGSLFLTWRTRDAVYTADAGPDLVIRETPARIAASRGTAPVTACNATACAAIWTDGTNVNAAIGTSVLSLPVSADPDNTYKLTAAGVANTFALAYASRLVVFDTTGTIVTNDVADAVAPNASGYLTAWLTRNGVRVSTRDVNGVETGTRDIALPFAAFDVSITATSGDPLIIVSQGDPMLPWIRLFAVNGAATPIDEEFHVDSAVQTAFNGTTILAGWTAMAQNVYPQGALYRVIDPLNPAAGQPTTVATKPARQVALAAARTDTKELAVWHEERLDGYSVQAAVRATRSAGLSQPVELERMSLIDPHATAASDGDGFAVLWTWSDITSFVLRAAILDANAAITHRLDVDGTPVSNVTWFDGSYVFLTYAKPNLRLNRLSRDGTLTWTERPAISFPQATLAPSGDRLGELLTFGPQTLFRVVDRSGGTIAEKQLPISLPTFSTLAAHDGQFLAVFRASDGRVVTYRLSAAGEMLDAGPLQLDPYSDGVIPPVVVDRSDGWLVVWQTLDKSSRVALVSGTTGQASAAFTLASPVSTIAQSPDGAMTILATVNSRVVACDLEWRSQPKRRAVR